MKLKTLQDFELHSEVPDEVIAKYENLSDRLEYGNISNEEAASICNAIIDESDSEHDVRMLEAMFHAVVTGVVKRNVGDKIQTGIIAKNLDKYNEEISDYIITILAFSGKEECADLIKRIGIRYNNLDIEDALTELYSRVAKSRTRQDG